MVTRDAYETPADSTVVIEYLVVAFLSGLIDNVCEAAWMLAVWHIYCGSDTNDISDVWQRKAERPT